MRFNPKASLDNSRVGDAGRGGGGGFGGGGGRIPIPGGVTGGGGVIGLIVVVVFVILQLASGNGPGTGTGSGYDTGRLSDSGGGSNRYAGCKTGADANKSADCARVAIVNSLDSYWSREYGKGFKPVDEVVTFTGSTQTGCGGADSAVGPFYCPSDQRIYLDSSFFQQVLERQLGGPDGGFVEAYVIAHEYGHHISNLQNLMGQVRGDTGPQSSGVRLELQADCYAGMWAKAASTTEDSQGNLLFAELTQQDIDLALEAASTVGDDAIQKKTQGQVDQETWTHGSSAQRKKWFSTGYESGDDMSACDTFGASRV